jgi:hypothetical protein
MHLGGPTREEWINGIVHPDDRAAIRAARLGVQSDTFSLEHGRTPARRSSAASIKPVGPAPTTITSASPAGRSSRRSSSAGRAASWCFIIYDLSIVSLVASERANRDGAVSRVPGG